MYLVYERELSFDIRATVLSYKRDVDGGDHYHLALHIDDSGNCCVQAQVHGETYCTGICQSCSPCEPMG